MACVDQEIMRNPDFIFIKTQLIQLKLTLLYYFKGLFIGLIQIKAHLLRSRLKWLLYVKTLLDSEPLL